MVVEGILKLVLQCPLLPYKFHMLPSNGSTALCVLLFFSLVL